MQWRVLRRASESPRSRRARCWRALLAAARAWRSRCCGRSAAGGARAAHGRADGARQRRTSARSSMPSSRRQPRSSGTRNGWPTIGWDEARSGGAPRASSRRRSLEEAARRINALLGELKTSHTGLLTPDDVDYYILLAVFGGASMPQEEFDERFWGAGVTYAGIGHLLRAHRRARFRRCCAGRLAGRRAPA